MKFLGINVLIKILLFWIGFIVIRIMNDVENEYVLVLNDINVIFFIDLCVVLFNILLVNESLVILILLICL